MPIEPTTVSPHSIEAAAAHLSAGRLVAFPTETVYGLGADAQNAAAVARIFQAKGRPSFNPLIVHTASLDAARALAHFPAAAEHLAHAFWPGALTLVLDKRPDGRLADLVSAGLPSVAIRMPSHPVAHRLLDLAGCPVAAPSANRSGHVSATSALHVAADLGNADGLAMILDDGPAALGLESTIVDARGAQLRLLRPGAVTAEDIAHATGFCIMGTPPSRPSVTAAADGASPPRPVAPGMLDSHYAPRRPLVLGITAPAPDQAWLTFGAEPVAHRGPKFNLSPAADLVEAAANLFAALRTLDASGAASIAAMPIPDRGLGRAINDRLARAAAPRPR